MTNVAAGKDVYSVSKIKTMRGRQGEAWSAMLLRNGKAVGEVINEANGGAFRFYFTEVDEETRYEAFIEAEKAAIPADKIDEESSKMLHRDVLARTMFNGDIWIENLVNKTLDDHRWARMCKTQTLFQIGEKIGGPNVASVKGTTPEVRQWISKQFPGEKIRFLNDEYQG